MHVGVYERKESNRDGLEECQILANDAFIDSQCSGVAKRR